jgi:uncharacterized membrane protein
MRTRYMMLGTVLLLVVALIYIPYLGRTVEYDEAYTMRHFAFSPIVALIYYPLPNNHLLHSFFVWLFTSIGGSYAHVLRFPAFAAGLISVALSYRIGRHIHSNEAGLASAAILAANPVFAGYAVSARGYSLSVLLTLLLTNLIIRQRSLHNRSYRYALIAVSAGLVMTLPTMVILIIGVLSWALWKRQALILPILTGTLCGSSFYVPSFVKGFYDLGAHWGVSHPGELLKECISVFFGDMPILGIVLGFCCVLGIIWLGKHRNSLMWYVVSVCAAIPVLAFIQFLFLSSLLYGRNYTYLLALVSIAGGIGLACLFRRWTPAVLLILIVLGAIRLRTLAQPTDVDRLMARMKQNMVTNDAILIGCCLEEPVLYTMEHGDHSEWFNLNERSKRIFIVETQYQSRDDLLPSDPFSTEPLVCQSASASWYPFEVIVCIPSRQ